MMTWDELVKKAREIGYLHFFDDRFEHCEFLTKDLQFSQCGKIKKDGGEITICCNKTPEQMWQIMEALQ